MITTSAPLVTSPPLEAVRALRETADNPPTSTNENMDFERCAALHNAVVEHAWLSAGNDLAAMPIDTVWSSDSSQEHLEEMEAKVSSPSLREFLKRALVTEHCFFDFLGGLTGYGSLWEFVDSFEEDWVGLYWTGSDFSLTLTAITYDQYDNTCIYNGESSENPYSSSSWYRLETLLSFYIDLIERGKVVALHDSIRGLEERIRLPDGRTVARKDHPHPPPLQDQFTGARRTGTGRDPWVVVPFAKRNLSDAVEAFHDLVLAIDEKSSEPLGNPFEGKGFFEEDVLLAAGLRQDGFAWEFFTNAHRPRITYLGPGLRLVTADELINNVFRTSKRNVDDENGTRRSRPVPILVGEAEAENWLSLMFDDVARVPWGLYLDADYGAFPVEDGCRLVLPYAVGANGIATTSDGKKIEGGNSHTQLYQIGAHPWMPSHSTQLHAMIDAFGRHVSSGDWKVGLQGVKEPHTIFKEADNPAADRSASSNEFGYTVPIH